MHTGGRAACAQPQALGLLPFRLALAAPKPNRKGLWTEDTACPLQSCCLHWAQHCMQCSSEPDCGLLYVVQTAFGRVVECGSVKCA